jgi:shikimate 5-dehydrogenase
VPKKILAGKIVFDAVYNPPLTRLLRDAADAGAVAIPGTEMYVNQALRQAALYCGAKVSRSVAARLLGIDR